MFDLQLLDFVASGFPTRVPGQLLLACFQEVLAPSLLEVGRDVFWATQNGDDLLTRKTFEHDACLLFGGAICSSTATGVARRSFGWLLLRARRAETLLRVFGPMKYLLVLRQ